MLNAVNQYLTSLNFNYKIDSFVNEYQSHPDYPSLLAISDGLTTVNLENIVATVPFMHLDQLPDRFVAQLQFDSTAFFQVSKKQDVYSYFNDKGKKVVFTKLEFEQAWTGLVLIIDSENTERNAISLKDNYLLSLLLICGAIAIFVYHFTLTEILSIAANLIGLYFSIEILKTYFKDQNTSESKWCTAGKSFSCNSVINSKNYTFYKYVEFVDLPIIYFTTSFIALLLNIKAIYVFGFGSVLAMPLLVYSIYIQKFQLKKWCLLCLCVAVIVVFNAAQFLVIYSIFTIEIVPVIQVLLLTLIISSSWFYLKKNLQEKNAKSNELNTLLRFKRNGELFNKTAEPVGASAVFKQLEKIEIGNPLAKNTLTLFLSPSCAYCHIAYKNALELLEKSNDNIKIEICFNLNVNNVDNPFIVVVLAIMNLYHNNKNYKAALDDWHLKNMALESWIKKWKSIDSFENESSIVNNQFEWCFNNDYNYAPVLIYNGRLLPKIYEIKELIYFIED